MPQKNKLFYPDELVFIKKNVNILSNDKLLEYINSFRPTAEKMKRTCFISGMARFGLQRYKKQRRWTKAEEKILKSSYRTKGNIEILSLLNANLKRHRKFTLKGVWKKMKLLGLKRTEQELDAIREAHKKAGAYCGLNKGRIERKLEVGTEVIREIRGVGFPFVKVDDRNFINAARYVWIQKHGSIPPGMCVYRLDNNPMNNDIENLICISKKEVRVRNREKYLSDASYRLEKTLISAKRKRDKLKAQGLEVPESIEKNINRLTKKLENEPQQQDNNESSPDDINKAVPEQEQTHELKAIVQGCKLGHYHDFKSIEHDFPKVALVKDLSEIKDERLKWIIADVMSGCYDEPPDLEDLQELEDTFGKPIIKLIRERK